MATALGAIPPATSIPDIEPPRQPSGDLLASYLTPVMDQAASTVARASKALWSRGRPAIRGARTYLRFVGLGQQWNMFWRPPRQDQYVRITYFVAEAGSDGSKPSWSATELVYPAHRNDRVRIVRAYWDKHRDKAIFTALDQFLDRRTREMVRRDTRPEELPQSLAPVLRYFASEFTRTHLVSGERIVRTEFWFGVANVPPRGTALSARAVEARTQIVNEYYDGPIETRVGIRDYAPYHISVREGDIVWLLEYFEEA